MKAYVREELLIHKEYPPSSIMITPHEWETLKFESWLIDGYNVAPDGDFEEGYNLIMVHPFTGKLFWAYSIDFDFEIELTNTSIKVKT